MSRRRSAALALCALMLASCGTTDQGVTARRSDQRTTADAPDQTNPADSIPDATDPTSPLEPTDDSTPPPADGGIIDFGQPKTPRDYDNFLNAAFTDITEFWAENFPQIYDGSFEPVSGIYAAYPEREVLPESCEGPVSYDEVAGNAFYTTCGDIIVYDDGALLPQLVESLGAAAVGVVAAHEYAHAIQARSGVFELDLPTVDTEQQADCFAGAWAAHVARSESDILPQFDDRDIKGGLIAMITVRDPPSDLDVSIDPNGHGTAFDRVGAFQEGFINGVARCADFVENPNPRIDLVFTPQDFVTGGNLRYTDILVALPVALDTFWLPTLEGSSTTFTSPTLQPFTVDGEPPSCDDRSVEELVNRATFCASTNTIVYDEEFVRQLYVRLGDLSFSYPLAAAYSDAVQVSLQSALDGEPRVLLNDCLVGSWIVDIVPSGEFDENGFPTPRNPDQEITLSAGDLDEAVQTAVLLGDETSDTDVSGTAFEKIDAFRAGVLGGLDACQSRIG